MRAAIERRHQINPEQALARQIAGRTGAWGIDDDGMHWFHLRVDPITGTALLAEADRIERTQYQQHDRHTRLGGRTAAQRRADTLTLLLGMQPPTTNAATSKPRRPGVPTSRGDKTDAPESQPSSAAGRPVVHLVIRADQATSQHRPIAHTLDGTTVPASAVAAIIDHAEIHAWTIDAAGTPLGHATGRRHATKIQRLALAIRSRGCVWAGCDRPARACDAHHLDEWAHSHNSELANLTLLCPRHHQQLHQLGGRLRAGRQAHSWQIERTDTGATLSEWTNPTPPWLN